jgi:hypothetical protein
MYQLSENPTYTIDIQPVGDHLQVTLPELEIVLETAPGKIERDDALEMAFSAISDSQQKKDEAVQVNVQTGSLRIFMDCFPFSSSIQGRFSQSMHSSRVFSEGNTDCLKNAISITPFFALFGRASLPG